MIEGTRRAPRERVPRTSLAERDPEPVTAAHEAQDLPHFESDDGDDDLDESTVADPVQPDEEPTTIRPTPLPAHLTLWEADTVKNGGRERAARARGRIGKYELQTRLAGGAFGVVYTARDPNLERDVAIKVLRPTHLANQDVVQRFLQEARATARVRHPGIVTIHDCGTVETRRGSTAFIAMELLSGESLTSRIARSGRLDPAAACEIIRQVASALDAAHDVDVLHRDLKPDNIYLVPDPAMPSGERVKVLDFGLAKLGAGGQTQLQTVFGTPRYMSPEQSRSATQIDHRSDIYSLGCILFELVTGRPPFDGDVRQLIERHQRAAPPRARSLAPEVPVVLDELIADLLAKDPMRRPQTMGAVQRALRAAAADPGPGTAPGPGPGTAPGPGPGAAPIDAIRPPAPAATPLSLPLPPPAGASPGAVPPLPRPSSSPRVRPASSPAVRPLTSPAVTPCAPAAPSVEISVTCPPASDGDDMSPVPEAGAMSGELLVPASGATQAPPAPPVAQAVHNPAIFGLCVLVLAALAALAVATIA